MARFLRFKIPKDAKLEEIIELLNKMELSVNIESKNMKEWVYDHDSWIQRGDE